jgi:hypothetical protein
MADESLVRPQQKICEKNVEVPTILVEPFQEGGKPEVFVQWFGESSTGMNLGEMQFRFPLPAPADSHCWLGHPELCKVIMVGQVRNWPKPEAAQGIADMATKGNLDALAIFIAATHYSRLCSDGRAGPACFVFEMTIHLADGIYCAITPRPYCDMSVLEEEAGKIGDQVIDRNDLAEQLGDEF